MNKLDLRKCRQWRLVALFIGIYLLQWNSAVAETEELSAIERQNITSLIYNYSYMFDSKNLDGFLNLYTRDAVWEDFLAGESSPDLVLDTPDDMRKVFGRQMLKYAAEGIQTRHFLTNLKISRTAPGLAEGTAMFVVMHQSYSQPQGTAVIVHTGVYNYQFAHTPTGWKFRRIDAHIDHS